MRRPIDIFSAGELLVEFIPAEFAESLDGTFQFYRITGGSPANLAMNMARLGNQAMLAACVGTDEMGAVLRNFVERIGVDVTYVSRVEDPSTLILVNRAADPGNFQAYRGADYQFSIRQFPYQRFEDISIFHTTCFALSKQPAQSVIMEAAEKAKKTGCQLSLDANYLPNIWPEKREAQRVVAELCRLKALIKISDADWACLYEGETPNPETVIDHFLKMGATEVCFTLGNQGCWVGDADERLFLPARPVEALSITGTGDAFWSGYLTARLDGRSMIECSMAGRKMAEIKLGHFGPLPDRVDRAAIYADLG